MPLVEVVLSSSDAGRCCLKGVAGGETLLETGHVLLEGAGIA